MALFNYLVKRLLTSVVVLLGISIIVFITVHLLPGDPVNSLFLTERPTPEQIEIMTAKYGLDKPLFVQYTVWLQLIFHGDLGNSIYGPKVLFLIGQRLPATLYLVFMVVLVAIATGIPLGVVAAIKRNTWIDRLCVTFAMLGTSIPYFFIAIILILIFALYLGIFPSSGYVPLFESPVDSLRYAVLPAISIGVLYSGTVARITRGSMIEVLEYDSIKFHYLKGLPNRKIIFPGCLIPCNHSSYFVFEFWCYAFQVGVQFKLN